MKIGEQVTFGTSGLDRAAHLRGDIAATQADPAARTLVLWEGKLLLEGEGRGLWRVPLDHPILADASDVRLFLGVDESGPVFAATLSHWTPDLPEKDQMQLFLIRLYRRIGHRRHRMFCRTAWHHDNR